MGALGIQGLALGIAAGAWFEASILTILLQRKHPSIAIRSVVGGGATSVAGASLAGLVAFGVLYLDLLPADLARVVSLLIELALAAGAGLAVYLLYSRAVRLPELPRAIDLARSAIRGR